jgi:uncharacterized protein YcbX
MIPAGHITSIWRYPVKSMLGEQLAEAEIGERGLHADRTWAVRDVELNATTSAKRLPSLHEQPELKRDKEITRTIDAHSRRCLGVYGNVTRAGRITEGDALQLDPLKRSTIGTTAGSGATKVKRAVMRAVSAAMPTGQRS